MGQRFHSRSPKLSPAFHRPLFLAGPTSSGKSGAAIALARRLGRAEIINGDAFQIYAGIEILSAAPTAEERETVPHHLFGIFPLDHECAAAEFSGLARAKINEVSSRAVPIVVGGSGLYLKSITHGLAPTPPGNAALRRELAEISLAELTARYEALDPEGAARTNLKNRRYVSRNLEICLLSGLPASQLKQGWSMENPDWPAIYLDRPRAETWRRINERTARMFSSGVVEEIARITGNVSSTAMKAIGLREIQAFLAGLTTQETCLATIQQMTRRYAKRQETWFRRETLYRRISCLETDTADELAGRILEIFPPDVLLNTLPAPPFPCPEDG